MCRFVLVFFGPFGIAVASLGEERANLSAFSTFVRFVLVWVCRFPLPLVVWEGLRFVIVALPGLFSYLFMNSAAINNRYLDFVQMRGLISMINNDHVDNNLKERLVYVYNGAIVKNRPQKY